MAMVMLLLRNDVVMVGSMVDGCWLAFTRMSMVMVLVKAMAMVNCEMMMMTAAVQFNVDMDVS